MSLLSCHQARHTLGRIAGRDTRRLPLASTTSELRAKLARNTDASHYLGVYTESNTSARRRNDTLHLKLGGELFGLPHLDESVREVSVEIRDGGGGDLLSCLNLLQFVHGRLASTLTVHGEARSAHAVIAALWPGQRFMAASARLMFHRSSVAVFGNSVQLEEAARTLAGQDEPMFRAIFERSGRSVFCAAIMDKARQRDVWVTPEQALEAHLVDEILAEPPGQRVDADPAAPVGLAEAPLSECPSTVPGCPQDEPEEAVRVGTAWDPSKPADREPVRMPG